MNIYNLEIERDNLIRELAELKSPLRKFVIINNFYSYIFSNYPVEIAESYILEFIEVYIHHSSSLRLFGPEPEFFNRIIDVVEKLELLEFLKSKISELNQLSKAIKETTGTINDILSGSNSFRTEKLLFPVLERAISGDQLTGFTESITVHIKNSRQKTRFLIVPSGAELEKKIEEQIYISFNFALNYVRSVKRKVYEKYEVIVSFDNMLGNYEGNSLGIALTIMFIEQLIQINNAPVIISNTGGIAVTGGHTSEGKIIPCGAEIITEKVRTVFFSPVNYFVIPKVDELSAIEALKSLSSKHPARHLRLIPVDDFQDVLNRRDLIEIKKQNPIIRAAKSLRKSKLSIFIVLVLLSIIGHYLYRDYDDNPAIIEVQNGITNIKNQQGRILWSIFNYVSEEGINNDYHLKYFGKIIDTDNNGKNEVILIGTSTNKDLRGDDQIVCFNHIGNTLWHFKFKEQVRSRSESLGTEYSHQISPGIMKFKNQTLILCSSNNFLSFASSLYFLDAKTGQRVGGILWNQGHSGAFDVAKFSNEEKTKVVFHSYNNGYDKTVFGILDVENIINDITQCPTTDDYKLIGIKSAKLERYILIPKSDYNIYSKARMNVPIQEWNFISTEEDKCFSVNCWEANGPSGVAYYFNRDCSSVQVIIGSDLRVLRDSLVKKGILQKPYTDTHEYCQNLIDQIKYWDGKKFISRKEWLGK